MHNLCNHNAVNLSACLLLALRYGKSVRQRTLSFLTNMIMLHALFQAEPPHFSRCNPKSYSSYVCYQTVNRS